ncbi:hypothetical protein, partial [Tateyamaria sp.]|uniref:hypothetical protein n=1 Tax=Tateyamaria sp. TaxID=1929288 RepID=UPI00327A092C
IEKGDASMTRPLFCEVQMKDAKSQSDEEKEIFPTGEKTVCFMHPSLRDCTVSGSFAYLLLVVALQKTA